MGGYWFIVAETLEQAAAIAAENPCLRVGLTTEIRPLDPTPFHVSVPTNETPASWRQEKPSPSKSTASSSRASIGGASLGFIASSCSRSLATWSSQ